MISNTKKAVLVGINKYVAFPDNCLNGCVNDIVDMRDALINHFGFLNDNIRVVTDERATKQNIMDRLNWLIQGAVAGDTLLFHYSGHGSQVRLRKPDGKLEPKMDELICPTNMSWDDPNTFIIDREFRDLFAKVPQGVIFDVVFDCCHSGSGTRDLLDPNQPKCKSKFLSPPIDFQFRDSGDLEATRMLRDVADVSGNETDPKNLADPIQTTHILNAACRSDQTSADAYFNGRYNGAFTYFFLNNLHQNGFTIPRLDLIRRTVQALKIGGFEQVPQLECTASWKSKPFLK